MNKWQEFGEIISNFSCKKILKEASEAEMSEIRKMQNRDSFTKINIAAIIFLMIQVFFIISDLATGFYQRIEYSYLNLTAEILISAASIGILIFLWSSNDRDGDRLRTAHFIYYFILETGFLLYLASDIFRGLENISNVYYNMVVLAVFAVYSLKGIVALTLYISIGSATLIAIGPMGFVWDNYQLLPIFLVMFFVCACFFRSRNTEQFYTQVKLTALASDLQSISTKDFLTKLPNRTALASYLQNDFAEAVKNGQTVAIMIADIDDFKAYNDFHSHMRGDKCLHQIGKTFLKLSDERFKIFRFGGEEFLIIATNVTKNDMLRFAAEMLIAVNELNITREDNVNPNGHVTISVGCSLSKPISKDNYNDLLNAADQSLYYAKRNGKNCYVYKETKYTV